MYWNIKKEGVVDSLLESKSAANLEIKPQGKLQFAHGRTTLQTCNLPIVAALAIYAGLGPVICAECVNRVIEHIESIRAEL